MPIVKNGVWIAIDSVEHDNSLSGTGRPGDPLKLPNPWQKTLDVWTKVGNPPQKEDNKFYGIKNGAWTVLDATSQVNVVDGKNSKVVDKGDGKIAIDVDINPDVNDGCIDFTKGE